ncbi:2-hydroxyacid dehydrogenase [Marinobacter mangrovi]|uniref:2-hydroxyacid dehydrogenase n=1 Tax=Marinobacter mangrovi TaxID=2803918 RepID=UPI0019324902|nr:glyoxylate/hydroxypyruvate reductase A [Marinobacter mangrovi]
MTILIIAPDKDPEPWISALKSLDPALDIQVYPNEARKADVTFALCWNHPEGVLRDYPNLRCICSMGAGVDHVLSDPQLPEGVPVIRLVDPQLAQSMFEYVCAAVMVYFRDFAAYRAQQEQALWQPRAPRPIGDTTVGMMGLGQLGEYSAIRLSRLGFNVIGWSRTPKSIEGITAYAGSEQLDAFLSQTDVLVCLLPLTNETRDILNLDNLRKLPAGACLVNVARGEHLVDDDLLAALDEGTLRGARLDVFRQEPLPESHPFWRHEKIRLTPHCSSLTDPVSVAPQILENYRRLKDGRSLLNRVMPSRGY